MSFFSFRERVAIEGIMPERALLKLKRAGISVYKLQKPQKNRVEFSVNKKDIQKVFAIYPDICYNKSVYSPYFAQKIGAVGLFRRVKRLQNRVGVVLGVLLFCALTSYFDGLILGVEYTGTNVYAREAEQTLSSYGIKPFAKYKSGNEDIVCAKLLALDGVEFCSVKKDGLRVKVEMRLSPFAKTTLQAGDMVSERAGTLISLTVLRGTAQKKAGDRVQAGETLVGGYFVAENGEYQKVKPIAIARIACIYENTLQAETQEQAFASAYLELGLDGDDRITKKEITQKGESFCVKIEYESTISYNY